MGHSEPTLSCRDLRVPTYCNLDPLRAIAWPVRGGHPLTTSSPTTPVHPPSLDRCRSLAFHLQTELHKERDGSRKVIDNNADMVHPLNRPAIKHMRPIVGRD